MKKAIADSIQGVATERSQNGHLWQTAKLNTTVHDLLPQPPLRDPLVISPPPQTSPVSRILSPLYQHIHTTIHSTRSLSSMSWPSSSASPNRSLWYLLPPDLDNFIIPQAAIVACQTDPPRHIVYKRSLSSLVQVQDADKIAVAAIAPVEVDCHISTRRKSVKHSDGWCWGS